VDFFLAAIGTDGGFFLVLWRAKPVSVRARRITPALACAACAGVTLGACASNPYIIGGFFSTTDGGQLADGGQAADGGTSPFDAQAATFLVNFTATGNSRLLPDPTMGLATTQLRWVAEKANPTSWPSDQGPVLSASSGTTPSTSLPAPFADPNARAVGLATSGTTYAATDPKLGAFDQNDALFELVFRATPGATLVDKRAGGAGWSLVTSSAGALTLELDDGTTLVPVASQQLTAGAWYHCLAWVSRGTAGQARVDCDGRAQAPTNLTGLGSVFSSAPLTVGTAGPGGNAAIAEFALFGAPAGALRALDWATTDRRRFAQLTGSIASIAGGGALPQLGVRGSPAYVDIDRGNGSGRHLFLVGPDWPRVACRTDKKGALTCGYLSEPARPRLVAADASAWTSSQLAVMPSPVPFTDDGRTMASLVPSATAAPHKLTAAAPSGAGPATVPNEQAFSFFARAHAGHLVGASVSTAAGDLGRAIYDLTPPGSVVSAPAADAGASVRASIEDWGQGMMRCAYVASIGAPGQVAYNVILLDDSGVDAFVGDGRAWTDVAGLQVDPLAPYPGSLLAADPQQPPDTLTYAAMDNVPPQSPVSLQIQVLLPGGPRLTDQAVLNLNYETQPANEVNLFVRGDKMTLAFDGKLQGNILWAFDSPSSPADGATHLLGAHWDSQTASMSVDGSPLASETLMPGGLPLMLDRIDVGFSKQSSGWLQGLVGGVVISGM
jgi:hypothetical protein